MGFLKANSLLTKAYTAQVLPQYFLIKVYSSFNDGFPKSAILSACILVPSTKHPLLNARYAISPFLAASVSYCLSISINILLGNGNISG